MIKGFCADIPTSLLIDVIFPLEISTRTKISELIFEKVYSKSVELKEMVPLAGAKSFQISPDFNWNL